MFSTFKLNKSFITTIACIALLVGLVAFTEIRHNQQHCQAVVVKIDEVDGHRFLTKRDVTGFLTNYGSDPVEGKLYADLDFRRLEHRLNQYGFIKKAQISRDLAGNLLVSIEQPRPIGRLISAGEELRSIGGEYISEEGRFFPVSMNYSARVPLLSGAYFMNRRALTDKRGKELLNLLQFIRQDEFWRAQITELSVDAIGEVILWPQVGSHQIDFGLPVDLEAKFKKLTLFYTNVLPLKGWERYHRVSVQYKNQLVCE